ncbi:Smr/MutS family protein, partial [Pseudomonas fulva]
MQDDDFSLFKAEVRGVKPITHDRAEVGKPKADRQKLAGLRQSATVSSDKALVIDGMSDQFVIDVGAEDELMWRRDGVQETQLRKLKLGQIPFEGSLDLHGMTVEKARETLWDFIAEATRLEVRCVRVTHGKAARLDGKRPMIKSHVNTWLRQHPQVLGFAS